LYYAKMKLQGDPPLRILVTGGAGFIGSNFVKMILDNKLGSSLQEVTVIDKLTYSGSQENLSEYLDNPRLNFVVGDICDLSIVEKVMANQDAVIHFAAESHVDRSIQSSFDFVRTNVLGTEVLLSSALRNRVKTFVHVSTDEVYGSIENGKWNEDFALLPNSPYAASKAASDLLVRSYGITHNLDVRITRCSNNYGPSQYPEKVIPLFITNLIDGKNIPIYGTGENIREWIHVEDHCKAIYSVLLHGKAQNIYNIAGMTELTNLELSYIILDLMNQPRSKINYVKDRKAHDQRYALDSTKIEAEIGFEPLWNFEDGLKETIDWYLNNEQWWRPLIGSNRMEIKNDSK
jgi:dTDP-glucose 4,6-dehydratase